MLERIIEFFKKLFEAFNDKGTVNPPDPHIPSPPNPFPDEPVIPDEPDDADLVSDGSDLISEPDTIGTLVFPEELEIIEPDTIISDNPTDDDLIPIDIPPIDLTDPDTTVVTPPVDPVPPTDPDTPVTPTPPVDPVDPVTPPDPVDPVEPEIPTHEPRYLWCLDNGHGRFTAGKRSPKFDDGTRFMEYEFNRDIVKRIMDKLVPLGVQIFNVVPEVDTDNFLKGRVDRANAHQSDYPKLFVSIHANAARSESQEHWADPPAKGAETWYYTGSSRGRKLASIFQKHIVQYTGMVNRGLKSTKSLYVIRKTTMTSCLTENGFYNHPKEAAELMKDEVRQLIADAHIAAILEVEKNGL